MLGNVRSHSCTIILFFLRPVSEVRGTTISELHNPGNHRIRRIAFTQKQNFARWLLRLRLPRFLLLRLSGYVINSSKATNYTLWGSNPRPVAHETIALTTELRDHSCSTCKILLPRVAQAYARCTSRMNFQSLLSPSTACGIRARNLRIRSPTPCP